MSILRTLAIDFDGHTATYNPDREGYCFEVSFPHLRTGSGKVRREPIPVCVTVPMHGDGMPALPTASAVEQWQRFRKSEEAICSRAIRFLLRERLARIKAFLSQSDGLMWSPYESEEELRAAAAEPVHVFEATIADAARAPDGSSREAEPTIGFADEADLGDEEHGAGFALHNGHVVSVGDWWAAERPDGGLADGVRELMSKPQRAAYAKCFNAHE